MILNLLLSQFFLNFLQERDDVYKKMLRLELPNRLQLEDLAAIQELWLERKITNYEYLTHLNKVSGRSFTDLMQYPVMPFVLAQYSEPVLDLDKPQSYRYAPYLK